MPSRAPASVAKLDDKSVEHYLREAGINKATELYRKVEVDFRRTHLAGFKEVARFPNFPAHEKWLAGAGERLAAKSKQWRGVGTIMLGGQAADVEIYLSREAKCFTVDAFIWLNGNPTPLSTGEQCAENMLYQGGDYFLSWPIYNQFLGDVDLSLLTVALPQSHAEVMRYLIDGESEWQSVDFTWTPENKLVRGGQ